MHAYDLEIRPRAAERGADANHGWVFGLPPGITQAQWPLDPNTRYPLMHGFTLLPPDHRVHGPSVVALSFFATAADQNDGGAVSVAGVCQALTEDGPRPSEPELAPFWDAARVAHPRLSRIQDILKMEYAVILLTQAEFDGPFCLPPSPLPLAREGSPEPAWLANGSACAFHGTGDGGFSRYGVEKLNSRVAGGFSGRPPGLPQGDPLAAALQRSERGRATTGRIVWQVRWLPAVLLLARRRGRKAELS